MQCSTRQCERERERDQTKRTYIPVVFFTDSNMKRKISMSYKTYNEMLRTILKVWTHDDAHT